MFRVADQAPDDERERHEARVSAMLARLHGEPLRIGDARDLVVCIDDEPPRVVAHGWARLAMTALGGPAFADAIEAVPRGVGEVLVVLCIGEHVADVRIIGLRSMNRGGTA
jgi:hypothetical protein